MTLRQRLTGAIFLICTLLALPAIYGLTVLSDVVQLARDQGVQQRQAYLAIGGIQTYLVRFDQRQRAWVTFPEDTVFAHAMRAARDSLEEKLAELGTAGFPQHEDQARVAIDSILEANEHADSLLEADLFTAATDYLTETAPRMASAHRTVETIAQTVQKEMEAALEQADGQTQTATQSTIVAFLIGIVLATILGALTTRSFTQPVMRLESAMAEVADGHFVVPGNLPYERSDEIGSVSRSFRSMTHRLAELDRIKAEFMSIATHELKTPLNVISGYAELLEERVYGDVNERQLEALEAVRDQTRILTTLVHQLLDISRLEAGGLNIQLGEVDLTDLLERVRLAFGALARQRGIELVVDISPDLPPTIPGDFDRLRDQVLGNVLSNAIKFTPEDGRIALRARARDRVFTIEVEDTGPGIPPDKLPNIFDKYFQVGDHARSKGAGLGLAIAREIVDAHGGRIHARSAAEGGTTICVELPMHAVREPAPASSVA